MPAVLTSRTVCANGCLSKVEYRRECVSNHPPPHIPPTMSLALSSHAQRWAFLLPTESSRNVRKFLQVSHCPTFCPTGVPLKTAPNLFDYISYAKVSHCPTFNRQRTVRVFSGPTVHRPR